jgi:RND family efflux transporter MFP subunit
MFPDASTIAARMRLPGFGLTRPSLSGRRAVLGGGILLAVIAAAAAGVYKLAATSPGAKAPAEAVLTVTVTPVLRTTMPETLLVNGSLTPWEDLPIGAEASGLAITQVLVEEGDWVKAGQKLAQLDDRLLSAQLKQTEAQIARARATLKINDSDVKRAQELLKTSAISIQAAEQREATADAARADLALAEAQHAGLLAQLAQAEIRAPADGLISKRTARIGKVVSAGDELFREVRDGILELDAEIPDRLIDRSKPGQSVRIRRPDGTELTGTVRLVAPLVDIGSRNGIAHVRFPVEPDLRAGMFVSGELVLDQAPTLAIPEAALMVKDGRPIVFLLESGNKVAARNIETGRRSDGKVAIKSGLVEGDRVVLSGAGFLRDGDLVQIADH